MKWLLVGAAVGVAYFIYRFPYAVGALVKYPAQLNTIAQQLNDASNLASGVSGIVSDLKADWASIENAV